MLLEDCTLTQRQVYKMTCQKEYHDLSIYANVCLSIGNIGGAFALIKLQY